MSDSRRSSRALPSLYFVVLAIISSACAPPGVSFEAPVHVTSEDEIAKMTDFDLRSRAAFEYALYPILREHCAGCHSGDSGMRGSNYPHSDSDPRTAYETIVSREYVNFSDPSLSRMMRVVGLREHPVQLPDQIAAAAEEFLAGISTWKRLRGTGPVIRHTIEVPLPRLNSVELADQTLPSGGTIDLGALMVPEVRGEAAPAMTFVVSSFNGIYRIRNLKVRNPVPTGGASLLIRGIGVLLNGQRVPQASGFKLVDVSISRTAGVAEVTLTRPQQEVFLEPSCSQNAPPDCMDRLSFTFDQIAYDGGAYAAFRAMASTQCSSCHSTVKAFAANGVSGILPAFASSSALALSESAYRDSLPAAILSPGSAEASLLYQVLDPTSAQRAAGVSIMPPTASLSARQEMAAIMRNWIQGLSGQTVTPKTVVGNSPPDRETAAETDGN